MRHFAIAVVFADLRARDRLWHALYDACTTESLVKMVAAGVSVDISTIPVQILRDIMNQNTGSFNHPDFHNAEARLLVGADTIANDLLSTINEAIKKIRNADKTTQIITLGDAIVRRCSANRTKQIKLKVMPTQEIDRDIISRLEPKGIRVNCSFTEGEDGLELYTKAMFAWLRRQAQFKKR